MSKIIKKITSTIIFLTTILILTNSMISSTSKAAKPFNLAFVLDIKWDPEETQKPIVPIDEIKELDLIVIFKIVSDEYMGKGALLYYLYEQKNAALLDISIVETSPGCYAVFKQTFYEMKMVEYNETKVKLYLSFDETIPAYSDGYVKIKLICRTAGKIEGFEDVFELHFSPSYKPVIKINLPELNTRRINPTEKAVFPIEVENAGNARTEVLFEIEDSPENWDVAVTERVFLEEAKGSKAVAYVTVIPPDQFGFHYDEANIKIKMTPFRAENPDEVGKPLYATFTVQNRGTSMHGIEQILFFIIIIFIIIVVIVFIFRLIRKDRKILFLNNFFKK